MTSDWAILKLTTCVGARSDIGWMEISELRQSELIGKEVAVAGYAGNHGRGVLSFGVGHAVSIDRANGMIRHSASSGPGQSGAPVMIRENGTIKVVAMDTLGFADKYTRLDTFDTFTEKFSNEATLFSDLWANHHTLQMMVEEDRKNSGDNPAKRFMNADWPKPTVSISLPY